jgi:multidrug resistance protein
MAGMSDTGGRRLSFILCFAIFMVANIGLAFQTNYTALLVLRMLQASGSSATIALSMAVVADVVTSAQRGKYTGFANAGILVGPSIGPVIGGALAQYLGWRSIFWFLVIFAGVFLISFTLIFPETCRNIVGNGSIPATGISRSLVGSMIQRKLRKDPGYVPTPPAQRKFTFPNPLPAFKIVGDKESALLLAYNSLAFAGQMIISAALPSMLASSYGYDTLKVGLCYLPLGAGSMSSSITMGYLLDWNFRRHAKKAGITISNSRQQDLAEFPLERARIEIIWPNHALSIVSMFAFGWAIHYSAPIAVIEVLLFLVAFFITGAFSVSNVLLIDLHRSKPATATAAVNLTRCLTSAAGVAAIVPMMNTWGRGWSYSFLAFLDIALTPALFVLLKYGPRWRKEKATKKTAKAEKAAIAENSSTTT